MVLIEILLKIILECIIVDLGVYTRYFFFLIIGKRKTIKYLSGDKEKYGTMPPQNLFNALVGFISFFLTSIGIAYLVMIIKINFYE